MCNDIRLSSVNICKGSSIDRLSFDYSNNNYPFIGRLVLFPLIGRCIFLGWT